MRSSVCSSHLGSAAYIDNARGRDTASNIKLGACVLQKRCDVDIVVYTEKNMRIENDRFCIAQNVVIVDSDGNVIKCF